MYPGWYRERTVRIHFKVHVDNRTLLTSQLFFDEAPNSLVYAIAPYDEHAGRDVFNDDDDILQSALVVTSRSTPEGQLALMNVGVTS